MSTRVSQKEVIRQSKNGTRTAYRFHDGHLHYKATSEDGEMSFILPYAAISGNKRSTKVRKPMFMWAAIAFWALGIARGATDLFSDAPLWAGLILITIAAALTGIYFLRQFSFTAIATARGQMAVLHDNQHDKLIDMLMERRKKQLLAQYRQTNYANAQGRRQAIQWLWENEVISETEYQAMLREVPVASKATFNPSTRVFN